MKGVVSQMRFVSYFSNKLNPETYSDELYKIKAATKELAFVSGLFEKEEVIRLYAEINERYHTLNKAKHITSVSGILSYAVTHPWCYALAYRYFILFRIIRPVIRPLFFLRNKTH